MARKMSRPLSPEKKSRRLKTALGLGAASLLLLLLAIGLVLRAKVTGGPVLPSEVRERLRLQQAQPETTPGQSLPAMSIPAGTPPLQQQLAQLQTAVRTGDTRLQTLYVNDAELNKLLAEHAMGQVKEIRDPHAYFGRDRAYITGLVQVHGRSLHLTVTAAPVIVNGGLSFGVEDVKVGSLTAPEQVRAIVQKQFEKGAKALSPQETGIYIENVDLQPGLAILSGRIARRSG